MPSVSAKQHRWIGFLHSHPEAAPKGLPPAKVDEWLHSDKGSPWKRDAGGLVPNTDPSGLLGYAGQVYQALGRAAAAATDIKPQAQRLAELKAEEDRVRQQWARETPGTSQQQAAAGEALGGLVPPVNTPGLVPHLAFGGLGVAPTPEQMGSFDMRMGAREQYHPGGFIHSPVAGRTDHLALAVPADSHVIPADVVSGIGQGNGLNGAHLLDAAMHSGPWGVKAVQAHAPHMMPRAPAPAHFAAGGAPERTTSIMAAGGEYIVRPEAVAEFGRRAKRANPRLRKSAIDAGHDAIDDFIVRARKHVVSTMAKLPGPVKG